MENTPRAVAAVVPDTANTTGKNRFYGTDNAALYIAGIADTLETLFTVSEKEAILCAFYDNAPLLMGVVELCGNERDARFLLVNRVMGRFFGRAPEAMRGKWASQMAMPPDVLATYMAACAKARQTNQPVCFPYVHSVGNETRFLEVTVSSIAGKRHANRFLFIGEDTTIRSEAQRKTRLLNSAVENARDAILITHAPLKPLPGTNHESLPRILYVNPAFEKLTGYSASEVVGQTPQFLMLHAKSDAPPENKAAPRETLFRHKNGGEIWVEMTVRSAPATPETGGGPQWVGVLRDITARKQAEAQMRLKDRALAATSSGIVIIDVQQAEHQIVYVNPAFEKMTGYAASDALGEQPRELLAQGADPEVLAAIREAIIHERELKIMLQSKRKDGVLLWRQMHFSPIRDEQSGKVTHFVSVQKDVTEQKEAEETLLLRERAVAAASNGIVICDARLPGMPIVYCNPAFETMTGYTQSDAIGHNCRFLQGPDTDETALDEIRYALQNARPCVVTLKNYRKNGDVFWNELSISPVRDAQNQLTHFVGVQNDVTERLAAQIALQGAEDRLRSVIQNLQLVVFVINKEGVFTFSDGKGLENLGLQPGEIVGRTIWEVYPDEDELHDLMHRAFMGEVTMWQRDMDGMVLQTTCNPQKGPNGEITSLIGFTVDVTERTRLEAQVLQSEKLAALGQLVAGVAHEINNPLAAISGHAQLLAFHPDEEVQADAQAIKTMTDRANAVVRSLLTFAHPSKGTTEERKPHTLRQLVEDTLHLTMFSLRKAEIDVHLYFQPDEPTVLVNANQIQQIILNLLTNAEHALRRAPEVSDRHIIVTTTEEAGMVSLTIADNGCGIPPAIQKRIFEPFFTTKDVGEGTGLGLSICHGIAVAHDGTLHVESSEGVGAAFILSLPVAANAAAAAQKEKE